MFSKILNRVTPSKATSLDAQGIKGLSKQSVQELANFQRYCSGFKGLSKQSVQELVEREACYQRYCDALHDQHIPFMITGERALQQYLGPFFGARDTEGLSSKFARVDTRLYVLVDDVQRARSILAAADLATESESSWELHQRHISKIRTVRGMTRDIDAMAPAADVLILDASKWSIRPVLAVESSLLETHIQPMTALLSDLLHQVLVTNHYSTHWTNCMHFLEQVYNCFECLEGDDIAVHLASPYKEMHMQFVIERALGMEFMLPRTDQRRYLVMLAKGELTDDDEAQICRAATEEGNATCRRITRRDSCSINEDGELFANAQLALQWSRAEAIIYGGLSESQPPSWLLEEYRAVWTQG